MNIILKIITVLFREQYPSNVFEKIAVHYVPMANPDGVTISQYGIRAIRKASLRKTLRKMPGANRHRVMESKCQRR